MRSIDLVMMALIVIAPGLYAQNVPRFVVVVNAMLIFIAIALEVSLN